MTDATPRRTTFLFDLDGTLIDSIDLIWRSYVHAILHHFQRTPSRDEWKAGLGRPLRWQFGQLTSDVAEIDALIATYRKYNFEWHDRLVVPYPHVHETLRELRVRGVRVGVVTSKLRAGAERGLKHCGLTEFVDAIVGADEVTHAKPHREPVDLALARLDAQASDAVMIGDSPHDIRSGLDAGTHTAGVLWGPFVEADFAEAIPHRYLRTLPELLTL